MKFLSFSLFLFLSYSMFAQTTYSKLKIHLTPEHNIQQLAELGIEIDHGEWWKNEYFINDFSAEEKRQIEEAGFKVHVLIKDVQQFYINQRSTEIESRSGDVCDGTLAYGYQRPENFHFGTIMGYFRYEEMLEELDEMHIRFPQLITERQPIGDILTHDENPLYWLRIGSEENSEKQKPEVLYTALHHAREPMSLSQLIYFMWFVLENYETNPEVKYLLDYTDLYFIPCVNPDGYLLNESTNPNGGGFWRKNTRDNNDNGIIDNTDGVDLNRNYGFKWGSTYNGSSSNPSSAIYRGTTAFSEPETQAVALLCETHDFRIAMNYHSFGNLLIYPWSYSDEPTEDAPTFNAMTQAMTAENYFLAGTPTQTVGYVVNGDANDWMYGEQESKVKIFAMTPEVGTSFWPSMDQIEPSCQSTILQNLVTAHLPHPYVRFTEESNSYINKDENELIVSLKNIGLQAGEFKLSVEVLNEDFSYAPNDMILLQSLESKTLRIPYEVVKEEEKVVLVLKIDNLNGYVQQDTIRKTKRNYELLLDEAANTLSSWDENTGKWNITNEDFYSSPSSITDSPNGNYESNDWNILSLNENIDLSEALSLRLQYRAKWLLEPRYDNVQVLISLNEGEYFPVCGEYSTLAKGGIWFGEPVYNGFQEEWVFEDLNLKDYLELAQSSSDSPTMSLQFVLSSDEDTQHDGFYVDDLAIVVGREIETAVLEVENQLGTISVYPNPTKKYININI